MSCVADNFNCVCYICAKEFLDLNFNLAVIEKISFFHKMTQNFTYSQKS